MKKAIISFLVLSLLLTCFVACGDNETQTTGSTGTTEPATTTSTTTATTSVTTEGVPTVTVYETLSALAEQKYDTVKLTVVTTSGSLTLTSEYTVTDDSITFRVEKANLLPVDGSAPTEENAKTVIEGTATVENGVVTQIDGEAVTLPTYETLVGSFVFEASNFENVVEGEDSFAAEILSVSSFLGVTEMDSNGSITVSYTADALLEMTLSYSTEGATISATYEYISASYSAS